MPESAPDDRPVTLDRRDGPHGEVALRRHGDHLEIIANGTFLMDTSDGRSERLLVDAAQASLPEDRLPATVLIGGLGVGFSLAHAAGATAASASASASGGVPDGTPAWSRITVVEREQAIIDWHHAGPLARISGGALADPRTVILHTDLVDHLRTTTDRYDALCLDIDNGPDWTVTEDNDDLYSPAGLAACKERLNPRGVLAVWSARPSPAFDEALRNAGFTGVTTEEVRVARGAPDVVHLAVRPA
ncbi:spermidine synthase [Streptomyces sp. NPDC050504]|uniref:spermidine synthase n=1 Tax=Streptomyces sp. NPDC050504 TaxID=3365618 RepID=UPI00379C2742